MRLTGGAIDVTSGVGFRQGEPMGLVRVTLAPEDGPSAVMWMRPAEARSVGLDLIGGANAALADSVLRAIAQEHGLDGDELIGRLRIATETALGTSE